EPRHQSAAGPVRDVAYPLRRQAGPFDQPRGEPPRTDAEIDEILVASGVRDLRGGVARDLEEVSSAPAGELASADRVVRIPDVEGHEDLRPQAANATHHRADPPLRVQAATVDLDRLQAGMRLPKGFRPM